jgi:toxin ParE1/3/4
MSAANITSAMVEVAFRTEASRDLQDIYLQGAAQFGGDMADAYHDGMRSAVGRLADFPLLGPYYPGLSPPVRYLAYRSHQVFYQFDGTTVQVLRILHHAMDAGRHL